MRGRLIRLCRSLTTKGRNSRSYTHNSLPEKVRYGENIEKYKAEEARLRGYVIPKKGDTVNLNDLLFTKERDYLIKYNNQQVKAEQLEGKVIALYFLPLLHSTSDYTMIMGNATLMNEYKVLQPDNNFEVVFVLTSENSSFKSPSDQFHPSFPVDCQQDFDILFSSMPWTAIPYSDVASRELLQRTFGLRSRHLYSGYMLAIVDPMGKVLQSDAWNLLDDYGASGYPFSDERIENIREEEAAIIKQPSLKKLLASPQRDYVISNKGDQVPIHTFEDKVVGLYFRRDSDEDLKLVERLKVVYKEFGQIQKKFEVVLIYTEEVVGTSDSPSEELFWAEFKTMPWLALPFRDPNCKKLNRIFELRSTYEDFSHGGLVMFGPHAEFIELFASDILSLYKNPGFPFTRRRVAQLETEKIKKLKLEMICDLNTVVRMKNGSQVPFCQLAGKRIILVLEFGDNDESLNANFLMKLKRLYRKAKGNADDEFEVIRVLVDNEESYTGKVYSRGMPWLVSRASQWIHANLHSCIWPNKSLNQLYYFPVFAFDQDGKLVRRTKYPTIEDTNFPFSGCDLEDETLAQLNTHFEWDYWDNQGRSIYTHSDYNKIVDLHTHSRMHGRHT